MLLEILQVFETLDVLSAAYFAAQTSFVYVKK